jgi:predicted enzyme related to lactoylglutathione lyase
MQHQEHAAGEPCWVTLATADPQAVFPFYQRLLGWNATWADGAADMSLGAKPVARIAPVANGVPGWLMHIAVDDVERSPARAVGAGGSVLVAPIADGDGLPRRRGADRLSRRPVRHPASARTAHGKQCRSARRVRLE